MNKVEINEENWEIIHKKYRQMISMFCRFYDPGGNYRDDIEQILAIELLKAIRSYDSSKASFTTHAYGRMFFAMSHWCEKMHRIWENETIDGNEVYHLSCDDEWEHVYSPSTLGDTIDELVNVEREASDRVIFSNALELWQDRGERWASICIDVYINSMSVDAAAKKYGISSNSIKNNMRKGIEFARCAMGVEID